MLAEFSIVPIGKTESLSTYIAEVLKIVDSSGVAYQVGPMGTTLEGDWDEVMGVIRRCHDKMREFSDRVLTRVSIDDRKGAVGRIKGKIESVESKMGKSLRE